ncbi:TetR/AcrR family transcriptional regulator [Arthrobacter sp. ISL-5]|uniref:TetR/AcrR family transcriptional regulator n=1 Tax=Arthrobacter sp. ISL-5 TaxID=2819111 RepID=UPI0027DFDD7C|nr:TetR/AcrR family transcriptional regulator [Arthrobacter sp. ISL-5]
MSNVSDARNSGIRDRILQTASDLFYFDGLNGVGVNRIIEEADVAKSTFYRYFPTKEHLVLAYLDEMDRLWALALRDAGGPDPTPSADRLSAMFDALLWDGHPEEYRGAAFLKASAEASAGSVVQLRVAEHRAGVLEWIRQMSRQAGAADPDGLARTLALLLEGALALGMPTLDPANPRLAQAAARRIIQEALS